MLLLASCQSQPDPQAPRVRFGQTIAPSATNISGVELPKQLGNYHLQGDVSGERQTRRVALYQHADGRTLKVTLYPVPGGWEDYDDQRKVSGQYIQTRQELGARLIKRGAKEVRQVMEQAVAPTAGRAAQIAAVIEANPEASSAQIAFVLSCTDVYFVHLSMEGNQLTDQISALQKLTGDLVIAIQASN